MTLVAKVRFSSALPQLDKEFDYLVPAELTDELKFGFLVQVPFGSGAKEKTGVVCSIEDQTTHRDKLLSVKSLGSITSVLSPQQLALCEAVAIRQAGTIGELISTAIPKRYHRVEKNFVVSSYQVPNLTDQLKESQLIKSLSKTPRIYFMPELLGNLSPRIGWATDFALAAFSEYLQGKSSLVVLPDFAELARFEDALEELALKQISYRHASSDTGSQRHLNHLFASSTVGINYGLRSAIFAPAKNLGLLLLWDDGDDSHIEQSAPYWQSREVLLQRAELEQAKVVIASHAPTTEVIRLIEIGHLVPLIATGDLPKASVTEINDRLDATSFSLISNTLKAGDSVLIQIATAGWASSLQCVSCKELRVCSICASSIWIDPSGKFMCRSCKANLVLPACACGKTATRPAVLGASAIAQQMERSFPEATVLRSNGESRLIKVSGQSLLVVSTPGTEPEIEGGYAVILIADAARMIGAPRLRAAEQSISKWANAVSLAKKSGTIIFVGIRESLSKSMLRLDFLGAIKDDYEDRMELALPPQTRMASVTSTNNSDHLRLINQLETLIPKGKTRVLQVEQPNVLVLDYSYDYGLELAGILGKITQELTKSSKSKKPGERVFRINMDDGKVI
jgi:primosomal protein N' (replication factor Y)